MASAEFLEEALNTNVDESAVNAIVGSLETQLVTSSGRVVGRQGNITRVPSNGNPIGIQQGHVLSAASMNSDSPKILSSVTFQPGQQHLVTSGVPLAQLQARQTYVSHAPNSQGSIALMQKQQEAVKLVYSQTSQPVNQQGVNLNTRVIYPGQTLPGRSIALTPFTQNVLQAVSQGGIVTQAGGRPGQMQPPLIIKQGPGASPVGIRPNSVGVTVGGAHGSSIDPNKNQGQTHGGLPANVQIVNVRPGAPVGQKSVAAVSPRVVMGSPQMMGARPAGPGITLQTLQGLQAGQPGHLLLKTENGQFQLLRVGPPSVPGTGTGHPGQSIRLTAVAAPPTGAPQSGVTISGNTLSNAPSPVLTGVVGNQMQQQSTPVSGTQVIQQMRPATQATSVAVTTAASSAASQKSSVDNLKEKCRKFLSNLLDLSSKEPKAVERNVRILIQELIDMRVEPEAFCQRLERLLDASPQPCLIGFLKKTLPILRQSLVNKELVIEGIHPPPANLVFSNATVPTSSPAPTPIQQAPILQQSPAPVRTVAHPVMQQVASSPVPLAAPKPPTPLRNVTKPTSQGGNKTFVKVVGNAPSGPSVIGRQTAKDRDKRAAVTSFAQSSFADIDKMAADDDINDVAAMGGVNLAEESQKILRSTEMIGTQIRSCKDEYLASMGPLQARLKRIAADHGLDEPSFDVSALVSHATQERLKNLIEKLACVAEHRLDMIKTNSDYEVTQDVKGQLKFLEDLDRVERKRREDYEREILLRAAKSRSKSEDPEQVKLKEKAKEMQRAEMEEMRQREANLTALQAIGPRKKPRISLNQSDSGAMDTSSAIDSALGMKNGVARSSAPLRARMKRVNYRDLLFLLEQEKETARSHLLYKCYLK